jgi:integral membrane protein (TIGR01906 family)
LSGDVNVKKSPVCAIALLLSVFLFILSFSIIIPILYRPIYYNQIENSNIHRLGPYSKEEIKEAYDDVLDYITFRKKDFSCGKLKFSVSGADHFKDCRNLIGLDLIILLISSISTIILLLFRKSCNLYLKRLPSPFYSGVLGIALLILVGLLSLDGFTFAFLIFHKIFFIGKTNWYFDPSTDEIINYMPESFFLKCAVVIGVSVFLLSALVIFLSIKKRKGN